MSRERLFNHDAEKPTEISPEEEKLRIETRKLRKKNNILVSKQWEIELQLNSNDPHINKENLRGELLIIKAQITAGNYQEEIDKRLTRIHDLEVERTGSSNVCGDSPYVL